MDIVSGESGGLYLRRYRDCGDPDKFFLLESDGIDAVRNFMFHEENAWESFLTIASPSVTILWTNSFMDGRS